ncbi:MAG: hypothetical protein JNM27_14845 [Leptospirales bacterium]|nr:hypothetical protein [Leptospirales bacterium]
MRRKSRITLTAAAIAAVLISSNLAGYETQWLDKKVDEKEGQSSFKADGTIFAGYERPDHERNGVIDQNGTTGTNQGFVVPRAYLNFRGDVTEGPWKGAGFRVTVDGGNLANSAIGSSNSTTTSGNSSQIAELKFAYFQLPLYSASFGEGSFRLGMQPIAIVDGQAGYSNEAYWKHRFIDQNAVEKSGFAASSADRGISFMHKADYFGVQLQLVNGEGFRKNNGQALHSAQSAALLASSAPVLATTGPNGQPALLVATTGLTSAQQTQARTNLRNLVNGSGDSYGYDFYALPSFHPTGKDKDIDISVGFPVRIKNITNIKRQEFQFVTANLPVSPNALAQFDFYNGDARAKQDRYLGAEIGGAFDLGVAKVTIGGGHAALKDKRSSAVRLDNTMMATGAQLPNDYTTYYQRDTDANGQVNWGYIHAKVGQFGVLARHIYGTGSTGSVSALPAKSYFTQLYELDIRDGRIGNGDATLGATKGTSATIDLGKARFKRETYAATWSPFSRLTIALGVETLKSTNSDGEKTKVNGLESIPTFTSGTSISDNVNSIIAANGGTPITANDFGGKPKEAKQVFVRAVYDF